MEKDMLKADEVAERLSVGRTTVYELVARGALPSVRIGGALRIPVRALQDWIDAKVETAQTAMPKTSIDTKS